MRNLSLISCILPLLSSTIYILCGCIPVKALTQSFLNTGSGIYSTGLNSSGNLIGTNPPGASTPSTGLGNTDPHYQITSLPTDYANPSPQPYTGYTAPTTVPYAAFVINDKYNLQTTTSEWIGPNVSYYALPGTYIYTTTFDLTGFNYTTAQISLELAADNNVSQIVLNSTTDSMLPSIGYQNFSSAINLTSGFVSGINTLSFTVNNTGPSTYNPSGLQVYITSATANTITTSSPTIPFEIPGGETIPTIGSLVILGVMKKARKFTSKNGSTNSVIEIVN